MRKITPILIVSLLVLASCKSKKELVAIPRPVIQIDTLRLDSSNRIDSLFALDQSGLRKLTPARPRKATKPATAVPESAAAHIVKGGTLITSTTEVLTAYPGVDRIRRFEFTHRDVPEAFEGFRIAFISDFHYKSLFKEKGLANLVRLLKEEKPDAMLLGGDYQEGCQYVSGLFAALSEVKVPYGTYGVMGNNDYERCHDDIVATMERSGMHVLEHKVDTLKRDKSSILIAGVRNPFDLKANGQSPTLSLSPDDFVILLVHTPDYVEDVSIANTDLALAGHTHGGQVVLFGKAPIIPSRYGQRFMTGLKYNSSKIPMIVTNGLGTSNMDIRIGAPSEIVMITLHRLTD